MNLAINGFQHLGIPVTDLQRSVAFYERLGFTNAMSVEFDISGGKAKVAMMQRNNMVVELYLLPPAEREEIGKRKNGHIDHIAFDVDDIDLTLKTLRENGFTIVEEAPVFLDFWKKGCRFFNILGPDGERLEFNQIIK